MEPISVADLIWLGSRESVATVPLGTCLGDLALARLVEGTPGSSVDRLHLAACPSCRAHLAGVIALRHDPAIIDALPAAAPRRFVGPRNWLAVGLAAAALAVVFLGRSLLPPASGPVTRDPAMVEPAVPLVIGPRGDVAAGAPFVWQDVPDASAFRFTIFDSTGAVVFEARQPDTVLVLPDSIQLERHVPYYWQVEARTGWDRWTPAPLTEFRVVRDADTSSEVPGIGDRSAIDAASDIPTLPPGNAVLDAVVRAGTIDPRTTYRQLLPSAIRDSVALDRVVAAYERTTGDDFLRRDLARFRAWSASERATRVRTDSIRVAGVTAFGIEGPRASISIWQGGIALAASIRDTVAEAALRGNIGAALAREGMHAGARDQLTQAQRLATAVGDWRTVANAVAELAGLEEQQGTMAGAGVLYREAIALRERTGDQRGLASDHNNLALLLRATGQPDVARHHLEQARRLNHQLGRRAAEATNLVNLAGLATVAGALGRAEDDLNSALELWRTEGDTASLASAHLGLAEVAVQQGSYQQAVGHLGQALTILVRTGPLPDELVARQRLAAALVGQGMLQAAQDAWDEYRDRRDAADLPTEATGELALGDGDLAAMLGAPDAAAEAYHRAIAHYGAIGRGDGLAAARQGLARLLVSRGDTREAMTLLEAVHREHVQQGDHRAAALARLEQGELALNAGDHVRARQLLDVAERQLREFDDRVALATVHRALARIELAEGEAGRAERRLTRAIGSLRDRNAPDAAWRLAFQLALVREARGNVSGARDALQSSLATLAELGATFRQAADRRAVRDDAAAVHARLALLEFRAGNIGASFAASEALRARELLGLLARGGVAGGRDATGRLVEREQRMRFELAALAADTTDSRDARIRLRAELAEVRRQLRTAAPHYAAMVDPQPVTWQAVASRLGANQAMIEYLITDSVTIAFVIRRDGVAAVALPVPRRDLEARVAFARGVVEQPTAAGWAAPLKTLHATILQPLEHLLRDTDRLLIVADGVLHYLPFGALVTEAAASARRPRFLIEDHVIEYSPSASVWASAVGSALGPGTGGLALAPVPARLPASTGEMNAVSVPGDHVVRRLGGSMATEGAFRRLGPHQRVLHLATFGYLNRANPLYSHLELAAGEGHDGLLEVHEVFGLRLRAELVVLSACHTAVGNDPRATGIAGEDWVGLSRAFLAAGARQVVGSLWAVEDRSTAEVMAGFYAAGGADDPAAALATSQRALLTTTGQGHPYFWAGFVATGRSGGAVAGAASVSSGVQSALGMP